MYAHNLVLVAVATDNLAVWKRNKLLSIWIITPVVQSELFTPKGLESRMKWAYNQKRIYSHNLGEIWGAIPPTLRPRTLALKCFPLPVYLRRPHPGIAKYSETRINTSLLFQIPIHTVMFSTSNLMSGILMAADHRCPPDLFPLAAGQTWPTRQRHLPRGRSS